MVVYQTPSGVLLGPLSHAESDATLRCCWVAVHLTKGHQGKV
jgi:hypothetical protein